MKYFPVTDKCIGINIVSRVCIAEVQEKHVIFRVCDLNSGTILCDDLEIHYVQLPLISDTINIEAPDSLDMWMTLIRDIHLPEKSTLIHELSIKKEVVQVALNEYDKLNSDEQVRDAYLRRVTYARDNRARMADAWEGGKAEGLAEGLAEGRIEGLVKGKSAGKAEKTFEIAQAMLNKGMDMITIAEITGLSIVEIETIPNS